MNITTVFSGRRADTVGFYVNAALERLGNKVIHIDPFAPGAIAANDLFIAVDDGQAYGFKVKPKGGPMAYWAIDTHINMEQQVVKADHADMVFAAQRESVEELARLTKKPVYWLPLACDPDTHCADAVEKTFDTCFIGNVHKGLHDGRIDALDVLFKASGLFYYGQKFFRNVANTYAQSKIVFNHSLKNDINMRVFEAMASGSMLLTDRIVNNGFEDLFDETMLATYGNMEELGRSVKYYLENEGEREAIAATGKECVLNLHTYKRRMETALNKMKESI